MANDNEIKDGAVNPPQENGPDGTTPDAGAGPKGRRREVKEQAPNLNLVELKDMRSRKNYIPFHLFSGFYPPPLPHHP